MKKFEQKFDFERNVLVAARERISYVFDNFEKVVVSISGGKDSTVLCHLVLQEAKKRDRVANLFFLDEEVVYDSTYQQIKYLMNLEPKHTNKIWLQISFCLTNAVSYEESQMICWEAGKHKNWMRAKEPDSVVARMWDKKTEVIADKNKGLGFYDVINNFERSYKDTAFFIGLRALESLNRWRAMIKNPGYKDIFWSTKKSSGNCNFYPIYDWHHEDIWRYIYDEKLKYSKIYDLQFQKGTSFTEMRISSLIHEKSFKAIVDIPEFEPKTYDKLLKRVKGISFAQETAKKQCGFRVNKLPKNFTSWIEYRDSLLQAYPDKKMVDVFKKRFNKHLNNNYVARQQCRQLILNDYENNLPVSNKEDPALEMIKKWRELL